MCFLEYYLGPTPEGMCKKSCTLLTDYQAFYGFYHHKSRFDYDANNLKIKLKILLFKI